MPYFVSHLLSESTRRTHRFDEMDEALVEMGSIAQRIGGEVDKVTLRDQPDVRYIVKFRPQCGHSDFFNVEAVLLERP